MNVHKNEVHVHGVLAKEPAIRATEIVAFQLVIPAEEPEPITPDATRKSGTKIARAILRPAKGATEKNAHGVEVSDADIPF